MKVITFNLKSPFFILIISVYVILLSISFSSLASANLFQFESSQSNRIETSIPPKVDTTTITTTKCELRVYDME